MGEITIIHTCADQYRDQIVELWKECLPGTSERRFEWLAQGNPAGPTEWFFAFDEKDGVLVAASSVMPKKLFYNGQKIRGGIVGDIMVAPAFRSKGIGGQIQKVIAESLEVLRIEFFYVVPNYKSEKLFVQDGLTQTFGLINYLVPIDVEYYLRKIKFGMLIKWIGNFLGYFLDKFFSVPKSDDYCIVSVENGFDEEIDTFWKTVRDIPNLLLGEKSVAFLTWKYCSNPDNHFRLLKCRTSNGSLAGYCVFTVEEEVKIHVYELVTDKRKYYMRLISALRSWAKAEQYVGIYFYTTKTNPVLKTLRWLGLCRIGGNTKICCSGKVFMAKRPWLFFAGDRNL